MSDYATHSELALWAVKTAMDDAAEALGRLDDLLTDNRLSPSMTRRVLRELNLLRPDRVDLDWTWFELADIDAEAYEAEGQTPFLKSVREMRMLLGVASELHLENDPQRTEQP